jgi:hypothetical protein
VANYADDLGIDELLRHGGADLRVLLVVFRDQRELRRLSADLDIRFVRLVDREARAVLVVLAEVGDAAGQRPHVADPDFDGRRCRGSRSRLFGFGLGCRLLFAAADQRDGRCNEGNAELVGH